MSAAISLLDVPLSMTAEQFRSWPGDGTGRAYQLIDGGLVAMSPPSVKHGAIQIELARLLANHLQLLGNGCRVIGGPGVQPRLSPGANVRIPDLAVTCSPISDHYLTQPVVLIEILSPSNEMETREAVRTYVTIPSVQEVLVIDSRVIRAEMLRRQADGRWPGEPLVRTAEDRLEIPIFGFSCPLADLYPE